MSTCPQCGLPPSALTENADTGEPEYEDSAGHIWSAQDDPEG